MDSLQVKFSVLGGASVDGESGKEILKELQGICSEASKGRKLQIKVFLDHDKSATQIGKDFEKIVTKSESVKLKFGIDTKHLDDQLKQHYKNYKPPATESGGGSSNKSSKQKEKKSSTNAKSLVTQYTAAYREQLKLTRDLTKAQSSGASKATTDAISAQIKLYKDKKDAIKANIDALEDEAQRSAALEGIEKSKIELLGKHKIAVAQLAEAEAKRAAKQAENNNDSLLKETLSELNMVYGLQDSLNGAGPGDTADQLKIQLDAHNQILANLRTRINLIADATERERLQKTVLDEENKLIEKNNLAQARRKDEAKRQQGLLEVYKDAASYVDKFGESIKEKSPGLFTEFSNLLKELKSGKFTGNPDDASKFLELLKQRAKEADAEVENLGDKIKSVFSDKYMYGLIALLASKGTEMFRKLLDNVIEIDTAMTELKKVTSETDATYERFLDKACDRSKELGALVSDVVTATADFARLGYGISDASTLADAAIVYKNVGDGITDISTASESIISTMQAFKVETTDVMSIVDRFNEVGNNFSITSKGIGDALVRSASALSAAGNTIDESIALITAANRVAQDPIKVGTAMKSLSMYLRAAKTELEDAGEDTEGMASSVSELRDEILALTGQKVDIQIDANTFKSTTQIIRELSQVWDSLTDVSQANILELIGGKRNSNVIVALIENFKQVEEIIESSSKSAGSALKENEAVLDSINGKINVLKASIQELSTAALNSELVKFGVDSLTSLVDLVTAFEGTSSILPWLTLLGVFASNPFKEAAKSSATLLGTIKTMFGKFGLLGKIGLIVQGISLLVTLLDLIPGVDIEGWFKKWTSTAADRISNLNGEIEDMASSMEETASKSRSLAKTYNDVLPRFLELYQKAGDYGSQGQLNDEEYNEFLSLQNQIVDILPQVDAGLDSNGNHMLALSGDVEQATQKLQKYYETQQAVLALEAKGTYDSIHNTYIENQANYESAINSLEKQKSQLQEIYDKIQSGGALTDGDQIDLAIEAFGDIFTNDGYNALVLPEFNEDEVYNAYVLAMDKLDSKISMYNREKANSEDYLSSLFPSLLQTDLAYRTLDTQTQEIIDDIVGNLDPAVVFEKAGGSSSDVVTQYFYDNYIAPMMDMGIGDTIAQYLSGELSLDDALDVLQNSFSDIDEDLKTDFIASMQKSGHNVNTLEDAIEALLIDLKKLPSDTEVNITTDISDIEAALEETKTEFEEINDIASKFVISGVSGLNAEEYQKLAETLPGVRSAYEEYIAKVKSGTATESDQNQVLKTITASAKRLQEVELAKTVANIADAFEDYGKDSIEVQDAMRDLEKVAPEVAAALWDEEAAMYDLSKATGSTAEDMRAFLASVIGANFAPLIAELSALEQEYYRVGSAALWAAAAQGAGPYTGKKKGEVGPDDQANLDEYKEVYVRDFTEDFQKEFQSLLNSIPTGGGGGGGSSQSEVEKLKELYDEYAASLEYQIALQEQYFNDGVEALDSDVMRTALIRQAGYYKEIQRQAESALEAVKQYYRNQGLSEAQINQKSEVQDLSKAVLDATQDVSNALDRMTKDVISAFGTAVDEIQGVYDTLKSAADEYAETGYITVDTLQSIISHGVEYMALLTNENGQLVINEENIKKVIAARTEQMAVEASLSYIEAVRTATIMNNTTELNRLLNATVDTTNATWGLAYATLAVAGFDEETYQKVKQNIDALQVLTKRAVASLNETADTGVNTLKKMQEGVNDILDYVMDMLKDNIDRQIEAIEDQKDAFSDYIEMRKEALDLSKDEMDYEEQKADLLKQMSSLQSKIDALDLVGTRESEAQKAALLEEQAELQKELADLQGDYAYDAQVDALDKMDEAYTESKDNEIEELERSISSEQKLYDMALDYIKNNWSSLLEELTAWNYEYGNSLESEIRDAWEGALAAAEKYGDYVTALENIQTDIDAAGSGSSNNNSFGDIEIDDSHTDEQKIVGLVRRMKANSDNWHSYGPEGQKDAAEDNQRIAQQLRDLGLDVNYDRETGIWYLGPIGGQKLYDVYHTGGIVGGGSIKQNEQLALLENDEVVLTEKKFNKLGEHFKVLGRLGDMMATFATSLSSSLSSGFSRLTDITSNVSNVTNDNRDNRKVEITFGDTYITGANEATIKKHQEINKGFMDELARQLGVKW